MLNHITAYRQLLRWNNINDVCVYICIHMHIHTHMYTLVHVQKNNRQGVHIIILTVTILSTGIRKNLIFALFDLYFPIFL